MNVLKKNMKVRDHSQHIGADGMIILKRILNKKVRDGVGVIHTLGARDL